MVALIPARGGSERIEKKNLAEIAGHPLVGIAVREALKSEVFGRVICSTDDEGIASVAKEYGAEVVMRPAEYATSVSPDVEWVRHLLSVVDWNDGLDWYTKQPGSRPPPHKSDAFSILRPTSPFRTADTIRRAWAEFQQVTGADSIRAVQPVKERPEKMWVPGVGYQMEPYNELSAHRKSHSEQSSTFPLLWVQNACLEMAWTKVLPDSIAGDVVAPFFTEGFEGIDINESDDLEYARWLVETGKVTL